MMPTAFRAPASPPPPSRRPVRQVRVAAGEQRLVEAFGKLRVAAAVRGHRLRRQLEVGDGVAVASASGHGVDQRVHAITEQFHAGGLPAALDVGVVCLGA